MIHLPTLYPHQEAQRDAVREAFQKHRGVIMSASPGQGKTRMSKWILAATANREPGERSSGRSLFTVHRRGLVDNAIKSFTEEPELPHGVLMSRRETDWGHRVQIASIDTLLSWFIAENIYTYEDTFDFVVFDECHSHHSKLMTFLAAHARKRDSLGLHRPFVLGLSATPQARGLSDLYGQIVDGPTTKWLIENEYLSPYRYFRATQGRLELLVKSGDEFTNDSVSSAMDGLSGDLVRDWKLYANGQPTVGFFPRLTHAEEAQAELSKAGIKAGYVDGKTPDEQRRMLFYLLNEGRLDYLCNVGVVERGTDIPRIGCIQLCTAIGSKVRFRQMIGRGSRRHPKKTDCVVIDHGGNVKRHGFFEDDVSWTLDRTSEETNPNADRPTIECPQCKAIYRGGKCFSCGYEPTPPERKAQGLTFDGAQLVEVQPEAKAPKPQSCERIMVSALYAAGNSGRTWKQAVAMAYRQAEKMGVEFHVPKRVEVAGHLSGLGTVANARFHI